MEKSGSSEPRPIIRHFIRLIIKRIQISRRRLFPKQKNFNCYDIEKYTYSSLFEHLVICGTAFAFDYAMQQKSPQSVKRFPDRQGIQNLIGPQQFALTNTLMLRRPWSELHFPNISNPNCFLTFGEVK